MVSAPRPYSKTGYKGVVYRSENRFYCRVWTLEFPYKTYVGGRFYTAEDAARYYDKWMLENIGDWVYLNFRDEYNV
jgi:hypothetical protein